jgi:hypothetical protein
MRAHHLFVPPHLRLPAEWTSMGSHTQPTQPDEGGGIDMAKGLVQGFGWVSIVVLLDRYTTTRAGYYVGMQGRAKRAVGSPLAIPRSNNMRVAGRCRVFAKTVPVHTV